MGKNTFDLEQTFKRLDGEQGKNSAPAIIGDYEIEPTGQDGAWAYRYQYKVGIHDYFGYAESIEEARATIIKAQKEVA